MRIIDKKHDFYDYLQDSTDNAIVFDRHNSFLLTKETICSYFNYSEYRGSRSNYRFLLMQCGATFWLMLANIKKVGYTIINYDIELLKVWKNYNKPNYLFQLEVITFIEENYKIYDYKNKDYNIDNIKENIEDLKSAIDQNNYHIIFSILKRKKNMPLLKASGFASVIDPITIFCAIEEYFSIEKMKLETTEPKGITNDDKIILHGFDTKTSFRKK